MGRPLDFEDFDGKLDENQRREYAQTAAMICESSVFRGELTRLINQWVKEAACSASSFDQMRDMQCHINALQLLEDRFRMIAAFAKVKEKTADDPYSQI